jgi:hypothetical protein
VLAAFKRNQRNKNTSRFLTNEFIKEIAWWLQFFIF